jgi:single-strand DNA-binding protein
MGGKEMLNKVILIGRLVSDPEVKYTADNQTAIARYRLAVNRKYKKDGEQEADFINCVAFGKSGEFAEKYLYKGTKIAVSGRIQTGSYEKDGQRVYTTDIIVEEHEFCESKNSNGASFGSNTQTTDEDIEQMFAEASETAFDDDLPF